MKHASLLAAASVILLSNAFALLHAARNRSGDPDAEITLSDRELNYYQTSDDSGVELSLRWVNSDSRYYPALLQRDNSGMWLNQAILQSLGFDCSVAPSDSKAESFYARQRPRRGFVALEYDGPAWQSWLEYRRESQRKMAEQQPGLQNAFDDERQSGRLVAIDAAGDPGALRARHPDRNRVIILQAVIQITRLVGEPAGQGRPGRPAQLTGNIQQTPSIIHIPRPLSDGFRRMPRTFRDAKEDRPLYRVQLHYGRFLEPWATGVEFIGY